MSAKRQTIDMPQHVHPTNVVQNQRAKKNTGTNVSHDVIAAINNDTTMVKQLTRNQHHHHHEQQQQQQKPNMMDSVTPSPNAVMKQDANITHPKQSAILCFRNWYAPRVVKTAKMMIVLLHSKRPILERRRR